MAEQVGMTVADVSLLVAGMDGVTERRQGGQLNWRHHGRLVARQLDDSSIVIRTDFEPRDVLARTFPETFSVPRRFEKHMMVVADLGQGDRDAIEDALIAAWRLQSGS